MGELIDIVDKTGQIIRSGVERDDAIEYPDGHMQIIIVLIRNPQGKFLVHKRAMAKRVNPGDIDHVCGGMYSGETPEATTLREAQEEGGVTVHEIKIVHQGLNEYGRYRYLLTAETTDEPDKALLDPSEVEWAGFYSLEELKAKQDSGEFTFVDGFFEDIDLAYL